MLGFSAFEVVNGTCELRRLVLEMTPDDHLGELTVSNGSKRFTASPEFNNRIGMPLYETPDDWDSQALFAPGDNLEIAATGGGAIGAFETMLTAPALLDGVDEVALDDFVAQARGLEAGSNATLKWTAQNEAGRPLNLFLGGSRLAFRKTVSYQAIEYFTLSMGLADDGDVEIPFGLLGQALPSTAYRIVLSRTQDKPGGSRL